jgi:hypothetical protein
LGPEDLWVYTRDQHFLIVGAIEDTDASAFWQRSGGPPKKVVLELHGARMLEAKDLATLRIDARHHVPNGPVLPRSIHRLKDHEHRKAVGRVMETL